MNNKEIIESHKNQIITKIKGLTRKQVSQLLFEMAIEHEKIIEELEKRVESLGREACANCNTDLSTYYEAVDYYLKNNNDKLIQKQVESVKITKNKINALDTIKNKINYG